jgi:hypothetical protein
VQGKLTATNLEAVTTATRETIRRAASRHRLTLAITDIHQGNITIDGVFGYFGKQTAHSFKMTLNGFIQDENIAPLGLQGQLLIAENGTLNQITIHEGNATHLQHQ